MIVSATTKIYDDVFVHNYKQLLNFAKQNEDRVHSSYIKVLERITSRGFTAHTETELKRKLNIYCKTAIMNDFKTEMITKKKELEVDYEAEKMLQTIHVDEEIELMEMNQMRYEVQMLFEYLKKNYDESNCYVFRCYYLYDSRGKKITYKQLSDITGYSISKCCGIIQDIKADLRHNLIPYINGTDT